MAIKTVLIADDEPHLTHIVAYNLRKAGFTVHTAANGMECVDLALSLLPDVIVTDNQMPAMDGIMACTQLRRDPRTSAIPIIMLTARGHRLSDGEIAGTNIKIIMSKPFSPRDLLARIAQLDDVTHKAAA